MILLAALPAFACPDLDAEVERGTLTLIDGDLAATRVALDAAASSFACAPATREGIVRYWILEGALRKLSDQDAAPWLAAAHATSDELDARLGPGIRAAWEGAVPAGVATLRLEPALRASVDGAEVVEWPTQLAAGPHVVQVVDTDRAVLFARRLSLSPGEEAVLPTGLAPEVQARLATPAPTTVAPLPEPPPARKAPVWLLVAAGAAAAGGGLAAGALLQDDAMIAAADDTALDAAYGRQKVFGYAAYGLWGVAGAAVVLHFVVP